MKLNNYTVRKVAFLAFLLITKFVNAQENSTQNSTIKFGVKAGISFTDASGDVERSSLIFNNLPLARYHIGGFLEIRLSNKFFVQPEVLYSAKGFSSDVKRINNQENKDANKHTDFSIATSRTQLDYLDIPIMMKYYFTKKMSIEAGPQIGFLVHSTKRAYYLYEYNIDGFNKIDFALNLGLSMDIGKHVLLGGRYTMGLSDIIDEQDKKAYNRVFQISAGYRF